MPQAVIVILKPSTNLDDKYTEAILLLVNTVSEFSAKNGQKAEDRQPNKPHPLILSIFSFPSSTNHCVTSVTTLLVRVPT